MLHGSALGEVVPYVPEQVEQLEADLVEELSRTREELVRRHPRPARSEDRPLDPRHFVEDVSALWIVADQHGPAHVAGPPAELRRDVEQHEVVVADDAVAGRELGMAHERAGARTDRDRRPETVGTGLAGELLGTLRELPLGLPWTDFALEPPNDLERHALRVDQPASQQTAWSQSLA